MLTRLCDYIHILLAELLGFMFSYERRNQVQPSRYIEIIKEMFIVHIKSFDPRSLVRNMTDTKPEV